MHPTRQNFTTHCLRVPKVFDWVNRTTFIKLQEEIQIEKNLFTDCICCSFQILCEEKERSTLWTSFGVGHIVGSVCIEFKRGCGQPLDVFINDQKVTSISEGSTFSATFSHLQSVEVMCAGTDTTGVCYGEFKINVHFEPDPNCGLHSHRDIKKIDCFLSDRHGNLISSAALPCKELTSSEERTEFEVRTSEGKKITLQRVEIVKQGFVTVEIFNCKDKLCRKCISSFSEIETFFLCAPPGTIIECEITQADCKAHIIPPIDECSLCVKIVIILQLCQSITAFANVFIELQAASCQPREKTIERFTCPFPTPPTQ
ncbi:DUF3992 domain-containing protein [Aneurinibacillus aneurinilyticus]|jgi:hypothetical protein|uniref:DUF3992 domain-containing protein n=1 Tax=Aneurinibacillus aneurinilyticus TaxID=1391 RepID=UPI0023F8E591|nr:S-Ena type endospore appendage [Aneurinibacillus aneurinilyticus]MCI1693403.1 DUF3992 domain-containing protein [Aneurinibacillus aneurinilyticus]